ncbi:MULTISPECIES: ferritin-like domain-containing protein [Spirosoma]|uniref:PA2169 family four-helix-bundle protein n=1 Tax=Spirosoma liriopis TaxID=2937440 RepID=A0ABT0HML1_9BACT|nr:MULTISPECIES: PA2169 family four-helix-bundle protein [Spirosoma]MCK8492800.1 PA2169 family four-helix-bundle protein [Spirosoma liriopis]UHG92263.1 PA2169 family four-helix-bundle protein [Spirosoma oryzicola]
MSVKETRGEILDQLNRLLTRSHDAEKGYQEASENVKDTELKSLFLTQSRQRGEFAMELDREIRTLGGEPDGSTSFVADLHRAWINIKSTFSSDDDKATVEECKRGDHEAIDDYNSVLQETDLVASTRELLLRQKQSIESAHASMARLALVV